jgi:hypothetical protein
MTSGWLRVHFSQITRIDGDTVYTRRLGQAFVSGDDRHGYVVPVLSEASRWEDSHPRYGLTRWDGQPAYVYIHEYMD